MGIPIGSLKPGMNIIYNETLFTIVGCEHAKLGRGSAFCRTKLKNVKTSQVIECTLRDSDKIEEAFIEKRKLQYSYTQGEIYHFLDLETYDDLIIDESKIEDRIIWLKDNLELTGLFYDNKLINLELPLSLNLKVTETQPGFRGNTVKMGTKSATLETGLIVNVPLFINTGEIIKIDTRTKEYLGRA